MYIIPRSVPEVFRCMWAGEMCTQFLGLSLKYSGVCGQVRCVHNS